MNTFMNQLNNNMNFKYTENGALAHERLNNNIYTLFAMGAAYRSRSDEDCILLFKNAYEENAELAMKCLFYIRDCRGGQGERRFFRVCMKWLAKEHPSAVRRNLEYIAFFGRWDDLYEFVGTPVEKDAFNIIKNQLMTDMACKENGISLCGKWLKSENASSEKTRHLAKLTRDYLGLSSKQYRQMLSKLRKKINVLERLMSANEWEKIEFDKIPSKAGLVYRNAFARRDIIAKKYKSFAKDKNTKVNAGTLYPYEIVAKAVGTTSFWGYNFKSLDETERAMINKYWENQVDYLNGENCSMMCVVDTSGSMCRSDAAAPINVAISLGLYCAERLSGPFANHYISFSSRPQLIKTEGIDFVDKVQRIYKTNLCENTNLEAVFDLLLGTAIKGNVNKKDIPKTIVVISDMEIDQGSGRSIWDRRGGWTKESTSTEMERLRQKWVRYGLELPRLIYWNVSARNNTILDSGPNVSFVSGMSPTIFKSILTGKTGWQLCLETICSERYNMIK